MARFNKQSGQYHIPTQVAITTTVTRPEADQILYIGKQESIAWTSRRTGTVSISIIRDGGAEVTLVSGITDVGYYLWTVTEPASTDVEVKVTTSYDYDVSDTFTIAETILEATKVTAPADGAVWKVGSRYTVYWTDSRNGTAVIDLTRDGGATWVNLGEVANAGYYHWVVTGPGTTNAYLRVTTPDGSDLSGKITLSQESVVPVGETSLAGLVASVNSRLSNFNQYHRQTETGDGESIFLKLRGEHIVPDTIAFSYDSDEVSSFGYELDEDAGVVIFDTPFPSGVEYSVTYRFRLWSDDQVAESVNSAIHELFGSFYRAGWSQVTTDGTQEFQVYDESGIALGHEDRVTRVEYWSDPHWVKVQSWSVRSSSTAKYVHFESAPISGLVLRISFAKRPNELGHSEATLEVDAGLPTRAKEPIVLMACADLLQTRVITRIADDRAHVSQGDNPVRSYEIVNAAQAFRARAELKASRLRMEPLWSRIVF